MKKLHLICNAHIDPVWQWTQEEGFAAAVATFASAADLADEFDYIFCHGESLLYEEIERKVPALFKRIKALVKLGRWVITGGWYLQPDCLLPCGESIVRQIETGRGYFYEKFGVCPEIATNYDSFGYSIGLVQILEKCGYKGMLVCRPNAAWQFKFPSRFFRWRAPDGSEITVSNSASYNSFLGRATEKIIGCMQGETGGMLGSEKGGEANADDVDYVLWGVGNHGGGPSRKDLRDIAELQEKVKKDGVEIIHSTPEKLFSDEIRVTGEVKTSLVPCMPGCYSSMARLKQSHREAENLFYATEKMLAVAELCGYAPDLTEWRTAQKKLLNAQFHDILPGTVVEDGERDGLELLAACRQTAKDYRLGAFLFLTAGEPRAREGEFPIFVFNYMPYVVNTPIEAEFSLADQNWSEEYCFWPHLYAGEEEIPCQLVKEDCTFSLDWRKRVAFEATLKPLSVTRFDIKVEKIPSLRREPRPCELKGFLAKTALKSPAVLEMADDTADPWAMSADELHGLGKNAAPFAEMNEEEAARFCGFEGKISPAHILEEGEVLSSAESLYIKDNTRAAVEYKFYKNKPYTDMKVTLEYGEKNKLVRLKIPAPSGTLLGDGPYITEQKAMGGEEITFQKWLGVKRENGEIFAALNDCLYGGSYKDGCLCFTLARGAGYCIHPIADRKLYPTDRYLPRIENGRYIYRFRIMTGSIAEVAAEAELFNQPPYALNVFPVRCVNGNTRADETLICTDKPVVNSVCRRKDGGLQMRFFNPSSEPDEFALRICNAAARVNMNPYEIVTVVYEGGKISVHKDKIL